MKNFLMFAFVMILSANIFAQSESEVLTKLQNKFKEINNFSASFAQNSDYGNKPSAMKGNFFYKKDNKFRIELKNSILVSDGESFWNFNKRNNQVYVNNLENEYSLFSLKNIILDMPNKSKVTSMGKEKIGETEFNVVQITPNESVQFETMKIWFNDNDFIRKVEVIDNNGSKHNFELSNLKLNQNIAESKFKLEIPQGVEVIDLR